MFYILLSDTLCTGCFKDVIAIFLPDFLCFFKAESQSTAKIQKNVVLLLIYAKNKYLCINI